ncbi:MAG: COX15/CtaA family protein [Balneolaceae bacterium]
MTTPYNRPVYIWLWSGIILISLMVIIGGITRLTDSGLSISDWDLIMGTIPPTSEADWQQTFERYQEFPQYQQLNKGMDLEEFKTIFFWEYLHRLLGRMLGIVFIVPFLFFWAKGYFDSKLLKRMFILLGLGALQGIMGWIMVKSGLVDIPYVSHYRLAIHLMLAFVLIGFCLWYALDLKYKSPEIPENTSTLIKWLWVIGVLFLIQMIYGAFTAGLDAGYLYNTFPKMGGQWIPPTFSVLDPFMLNFVENPGAVQWVHRLNGTFLLIAVVLFWWKSVFGNESKWIHALSGILLSIITLQYLLGILTLIYSVPISLGVIHQAVAILFLLVYLVIFHRLKSNHTT